MSEPKYPLCVRVPFSVHAKYRALSPLAKEYFRTIIIKMLESGQLTKITNEIAVVNLNINVNHNEVKPSISVSNVVGDPELTKEYVRTLEAELRQAKAIIRKKNEEIEKLRKLLSAIATFARYGDLANIKKVLAKGVVA